MSSSSTPAEGAGVYLHFPFCSAVCPYCDFAVLTARSPRRARYPGLLIQEIEQVAPGARDFAPMDTVYLGGGTPSLVPPEDLERVLAALGRHFPLEEDCRLHMEANPEDVTEESAVAWRQLGVKFLSLGVQSLDAGSLRFLGRRHSPAQARAAFAAARDAGIETVSLDIIFGLPERPRDLLERDLGELLDLQPDHVSCYQLTIEPGTLFARRSEAGAMRQLSLEDQAERYALVHERLARGGLHAYEVSNFARGPRHESQHNRKYWRHAPYLGVGPSAHSYREGRRWWNVRSLTEWESRIEKGCAAREGEERLTAQQIAFERVMLGLRTARGMDLEELQTAFGVYLERDNREVLDRFVREGLLRYEGGRLCPTPRGMAVADGLARSLSVRTEVH